MNPGRSPHPYKEALFVVLPKDQELICHLLAHVSPLVFPSLGVGLVPRNCRNIETVSCPHSPGDIGRVLETNVW